MSAVGDIIPLQPQIVITLTMFWKTKNIQHKWYLPSARMVLSLRTLCAKPPHISLYTQIPALLGLQHCLSKG